MKLDYIQFVFENCDSLTINGRYVGDFEVSDLKTSFSRIACNAIERIDEAHTFAIEIHKDANVERYAFDQTQLPDFKHTVFERLTQYSDITEIIFSIDGEQLAYFINWVGEDECHNGAQKHYISKEGHLYLVISATEDIEDFFEIEAIDDHNDTELHFDMCGVGDEYSNSEG